MSRHEQLHNQRKLHRMRWFEEAIPIAIHKAKSTRAVFIVFIAGEDDKSREMESYLHHEDVTAVCEENKCVAVKLTAGSNDCKFFSQIYPIVVIPSTFFIGDTGIPLEVIGECKSHEDFLAKVKKALDLQKKSSASGESSSQAANQQSGPSQQKKHETENREPPETFSEDITTEDDGGVAGATAAVGSGDDAVPEEKQEDGLEERVEKAKQRLEQKKEEKKRQEAEDAKQRELERRTIGQGVQKLRQQQKEMEVIEARMELKKDREEDKLARQRVKEEIERDKAEKAARFHKEKDERAKAAEEAKKKKLLEQQAAQAEEQARRSDTARIQFRMPNGSSVTHQFCATDTFSSVHQFITQHMGSDVSLSMTFPRRTFTREDHNSTLQELQLAPSAAILVIPGGISTSAVRSSSSILSLSGISRIVLVPVWFLWNLIASIFGLSATSSRAQPGPSTSNAVGGDRRTGSAIKRPAAAASSSRQDGSVRRFHNTQDDDDDDERNTWNGNSTQQM